MSITDKKYETLIEVLSANDTYHLHATALSKKLGSLYENGQLCRDDYEELIIAALKWKFDLLKVLASSRRVRVEFHGNSTSRLLNSYSDNDNSPVFSPKKKESIIEGMNTPLSELADLNLDDLEPLTDKE